jgi:hypothetical protein
MKIMVNVALMFNLNVQTHIFTNIVQKRTSKSPHMQVMDDNTSSSVVLNDVRFSKETPPADFCSAFKND